MTKRTGWGRVWSALVATTVAMGSVVVVASPAGAAGTVTVTADQTDIVEGTSGTFTVTRSDTTEADDIPFTVTASDSPADIASVTDDDISPNDSSLRFEVGETTRVITVTAFDDADGELGETVTVDLQAGANTAVGAPGSANSNLIDDVTGDQGTVSFTSSGTGVTETDTDFGVPATLQRVGGSEGTVAVTPAGSNADITVPGALITWLPGDDLDKSFNVTVVGEDLAEGPTPEPHIVTLTPSAGTTTSAPNTFTVTITDEVPVGGPDTYGVPEDGALNTAITADPSVLANDTPGEGAALTAVLPSVPANGSVALLPNGNFTYTPDPNFSGPDSFTYTARDGAGSDSAPITVTITVNGVNDPPTAVNNAYPVNEDSVLTVNVANGVRNSNDSDVEDAVGALSVAVNTPPAQGDLVFNSNGSFTYTPDANFSGVDSFTYVLTDSGGLTDNATVTITVNDFNADPVAVDDTFFDVPAGVTSAYSVLFVGTPDSDQDGDSITITAWDATSTAGGTVSCLGGTICSYNPAAGFLGIDTFTYTISDGNGGTDVGLVTLFVGMPRDCDPFPRIGGTITGTEGDDVICGTNAADTIVGGGGDDVILGLGGNDTLDGGAGSDALNGGAGTDTVVHNGTTGTDVITASAGSAGNDTHGDVERVVVNALGGGDTVVVTPSASVALEVHGGTGFDRLEYQKAGLTNVVDSGSRITADGVLDVDYTSFETVLTEGTGFFGGEGPDSPALGTAPIFINSPAGGLHIDLLGGSDQVEIEFGALAGVVEVVDTGADGDDTLKVYGQTGLGDVIEVGDTSVTSAGQTINYEDMERLIVDGRGGDDTINVNLGTEVAAAAFPLPGFVLLQGGGGTDLAVLTYPQSCTIDQTASPVTISLSDGTVVTLDPTLEGADVTCGGVRNVVSSASGYWMARASGGIFAFGQVQTYGSAPSGAPLSALDNHPANIGHWAVEEDGTVHAFGLAQHHGDADEFVLNGAIVSLASSRTGDGYYLLGTDGGVFSYGDAAFHGSTGNIVLNQPVVSMAANPAGEGYWFVATDGGIFTFGPETSFHGSVPLALGPGVPLAQPIVGMTPTATGNGYWLVAADGGIFAFGDAQYYGSVPEALGPGVLPNQPIVGIVASPTGNGYWIVAADGGVFAFGDAFFWGSLGAGSTITDLVAFAG